MTAHTETTAGAVQAFDSAAQGRLTIPVPDGSAQALTHFCDLGHQAVEVAERNVDLMTIREGAQRAAHLAAAAGWKKLAARCSALVARAERRIVELTPPKQGERTDLKPTPMPQPGDPTPDQLNKMRRAHSKLDDETFEELVQKAEDTGQPITRTGLINQSKPVIDTGNAKPEPKPEETSGPRGPKLDSGDRWAELVSQLEGRIVDLEEQLAIYQGAEGEHTDLMQRQLDTERERVRVQEKRINSLLNENAKLRSENTRLTADNRKLRSGASGSSGGKNNG